MIAELARRRLALATAVSIAGIAVFWITKMPPSLLVPVAAAFLYARGRAALILYATCATAFTLLAFAALVDTSGTRDLLLSWSLFFALALCIGAVVTARVSGSFKVYDENRGSGPPSLRDIHPDDRAAAERAMAYAFWTGVPQIQSNRQRQLDGSYGVAEFRAEPGYDVSVDVNSLVSRPDERWTNADSVGETAEAIAAAKIIESLFGKAWAFDAGGKFTYVTPVAG